LKKKKISEKNKLVVDEVYGRLDVETSLYNIDLL
jgi:hypothetical protein